MFIEPVPHYQNVVSRYSIEEVAKTHRSPHEVLEECMARRAPLEEWPEETKFLVDPHFGVLYVQIREILPSGYDFQKVYIYDLGHHEWQPLRSMSEYLDFMEEHYPFITRQEAQAYLDIYEANLEDNP